MTIPPIHTIPEDETLTSYLMDAMPYDWGPILAPWSPPLPPMAEVVAASYFCDVFVADSDGSIHWLNASAGRVDKIANSRDDFFDRLSREYVAFLKTPIMDAIMSSGMLIPPDHVVGLRKPEMEGGKYRLDNIATAPMEAAFAFLGDLYHRIRLGETGPSPKLPWMN